MWRLSTVVPSNFGQNCPKLGHFLETASLYLPPAALRLFPAGALVKDEDSEDQQISLL